VTTEHAVIIELLQVVMTWKGGKRMDNGRIGDKIKWVDYPIQTKPP